MSELPVADGAIFFAQVGDFSHTNDSLLEHMPAHLGGLRLESYRVYPVIKGNPVYLAACLAAVPYYYGLSALRDRSTLVEKMVKSPAFFRLATWLVRRRAARISDLRAVLQTQGLFNGKIGALPLVLYTDNTVMNSMNAAEAETSPIIPLERALYHETSRLCVAANHVTDLLETFYGIPRDKVDNIHMGANTPPAPPSPPDRFENQEILFIGIDWERKGGPELVEAFRRLRDRFPKARLKIIGCNPAVDVENVEILGRVPLETVASHIATAAIFAMPSKVEPFGIAVIEAARAGLPVVGTAVGGMLESVVSGKTGFLVTPGNIDELEGALATLLADPLLCESMGREGAAWAEEFSWELVSRRIVDNLAQAMTR